MSATFLKTDAVGNQSRKWQDVRLINQNRDSFVGTQSMTGKLWIKMDILGGLRWLASESFKDSMTSASG